MYVTIKLFATLRNHRFKVETKEYAANINVGYIVKELQIKEDDLAIIFVNGRDVPLDYQLSDGDVLALFPPVGGG